MEGNLTEKQIKFCIALAENGGNAYQAAIKSGYSENYARIKAHKLARKPSIKERLAVAYQQAENDFDISFEWKIKKLKRIIDLVSDDLAQVVTPAQARAAIQAIAELNKMEGHLAPNKRLNLTVDVTKARLLEAKRQYEEY